MLEIENLSFSYSNSPIIKALFLRLREGEIVSLIGLSGCGKTTLFKLIAGLLPLQQGIINIAGRPICGHSPLVTYMMQQDLLLPWRTILKNLTICQELMPTLGSAKEVRQRALELLHELGLGGYAESYPHELSGGMRQRASLARSLLQDRPLLLLDEPFGALDLITREQMYLLIKNLRERHRKTILLVTHDFYDALSISNRICLMGNGTLSQEWDIPANLADDPQALGSFQILLRTSLQSYSALRTSINAL